MICCQCGRELDGDIYVCLDDWLQWEHFTKLDPSQTLFCSKECFADYWSVEGFTREDYERELA